MEQVGEGVGRPTERERTRENVIKCEPTFPNTGKTVVAVRKDHMHTRSKLLYQASNKPDFRLESSATHLQDKVGPTWNQSNGFVKPATEPAIKNSLAATPTTSG